MMARRGGGSARALALVLLPLVLVAGCCFESARGDPVPSSPPKSSNGTSWTSGNASNSSQRSVPFESVEVQAQVVFPAEGEVVRSDFVEVLLNMWCPDAETFAWMYAEARLCLSVDGLPYACWALFGMSTPPLIANLAPGEHTLEAMVTDPRSFVQSAVLRRSWSGTRRFKVATNVDGAVQSATDANKKDAEASSAEDLRERLSIPIVSVDEPREHAKLPGHFEVTYGVESDEPERFEVLFQRGHVCFHVSVDNLPAPRGAVPCWPVFHNKRRPLWTELSDGFRTIRPFLLHPDSKKLILETSDALRTVVNYVTVNPDGRHNTLPIGGTDQSEDLDAKTAPAWREHLDPDTNRAYYHAESEEATTWDAPLGTEAPPRQPDVATAMVKLDLNGNTRIFPIRSGTDIQVAATAFCRAEGVLNLDCVDTAKTQVARALNQAEDAFFAAQQADDAKTSTAPKPPPRQEPPRQDQPRTSPDDGLAPLHVTPPPSRLPAQNLPPQAATPPPKQPIDRLIDLKNAFEDNLINDEEYAERRAAILNLM